VSLPLEKRGGGRGGLTHAHGHRAERAYIKKENKKKGKNLFLRTHLRKKKKKD